MREELELRRSDSINDKLIRLTVEGLSAERISAELDGIMPPAKVRLRVDELLKETDWLNNAQQEVALIRVMRRNLSQLQAFLEDGIDGDAMKISLSYIESILKRMDKQQEGTQAKLDEYNANVGRLIGRVVDQALTYMKGALRQQVDGDEWDVLVRDALRAARIEIEKHQRVDPS
ncbi:MAG: hypothetical protein ACTH32_06730 [Microbacterium gubbeenense]|uniref:hypothetical protein n=1 Tax=Microbacterium gubbeenense TaxID=159896 RepID=UPI003F9A3549